MLGMLAWLTQVHDTASFFGLDRRPFVLVNPRDYAILEADAKAYKK